MYDNERTLLNNSNTIINIKMSNAMLTSKKLVTVEKIDFSKIAPTWNKRLSKLPVSFLKKMKWFLDIHNQDICIVGEAYGFNSRHVQECYMCNKFSLDFESHFMKDKYRELETTKEKFVEHWNEHHTDITYSLMRNRRTLRWYDSFIRFDDYLWVMK